MAAARALSSIPRIWRGVTPNPSPTASPTSRSAARRASSSSALSPASVT